MGNLLIFGMSRFRPLLLFFTALTHERSIPGEWGAVVGGGAGGSRLRLLHLLLVGISALLSELGACSAHTALGRAPLDLPLQSAHTS